MIDILLSFAERAGQTMIKSQQDAGNLGNKDSSVCSIVTKTDVLISDMFAKTVAKNFANLNYMIIDEETISQYGDKVFEKTADTEYQFVIDPIDGTIQYANAHPLYGLTVGVYKNTKPLLGLIYLPQTRELLYFDGKKCYYSENAFTANERKTELLPHTKTASPIIFGHYWLWQLTENFSLEKTLLLNYFSAVSQSLYTLTGKAKAYALSLHLWDIAGVIPIADYLGYKILEYGTKKSYNAISEEFFTKGMDTKNPCILCFPEDFEEICTILKPRKN